MSSDTIFFPLELDAIEIRSKFDFSPFEVTNIVVEHDFSWAFSTREKNHYLKIKAVLDAHNAPVCIGSKF